MTSPHPPSTADEEATRLNESNEVLIEAETTRALKRDNQKIIRLVAVVATFMVIAHFTPLRAWITNVQVWKAAVQDLGWIAHSGFVAACAAAVMIGLPRLPLCATAGLLFGFVEGLALSLTGSVLGSYGAYLITKQGARRAILTRVEHYPWLRKLLEKPSLWKVFWVRQMMLPGLVLNVLLGVSTVRHRTFLFGTALGYLPLNIAFTLVGSGLGKGDLAHTMTQLLGAIAVVNLLGWGVWKWIKRSQSAEPKAG